MNVPMAIMTVVNLRIVLTKNVDLNVTVKLATVEVNCKEMFMSCSSLIYSAFYLIWYFGLVLFDLTVHFIYHTSLVRNNKLMLEVKIIKSVEHADL